MKKNPFSYGISQVTCMHMHETTRTYSSSWHRSVRTPRGGRQGNNADTPPPPRYPPNPNATQTGGTQRNAASSPSQDHRKNPIKRRGPSLPRRRSSFSYTETPTPPAKKPSPHTRPNLFLPPNTSSSIERASRRLAGRPAVYTQGSQGKHSSLASFLPSLATIYPKAIACDLATTCTSWAGYTRFKPGWWRRW
jgi:hypothetical protein